MMDPDTPLEFYAHGKLLLTGEYAVLDGATALAIPTRFGQSMTVRSTKQNGCRWKSIDSDDAVWFETEFGSDGGILSVQSGQRQIAETLRNILSKAQQLQPDFNPFRNYEIETLLEFPIDWGLGTSSTLLFNIAQWANVDPVQLLRESFGGSGYDVAVAQNKTPILYQIEKGQPEIQIVQLLWDFKDRLFFVYLNSKQNSKEGIALYKKSLEHQKAPLERISELTHQITSCSQFSTCISLFETHEAVISELLGLPTVKDRLFADYNGLVKSLGAWGGDFVLVSGDPQDMDYFRRKGYDTIISFSEMIA